MQQSFLIHSERGILLRGVSGVQLRRVWCGVAHSIHPYNSSKAQNLTWGDLKFSTLSLSQCPLVVGAHHFLLTLQGKMIKDRNCCT